MNLYICKEPSISDHNSIFLVTKTGETYPGVPVREYIRILKALNKENISYFLEFQEKHIYWSNSNHLYEVNIKNILENIDAITDIQFLKDFLTEQVLQKI